MATTLEDREARRLARREARSLNRTMKMLIRVEEVLGQLEFSSTESQKAINALIKDNDRVYRGMEKVRDRLASQYDIAL